MSWLSAWWQQIRGHVPPDPWEHDQRIVAARAEQHQRIDKAQRLLSREGLALRRERRFWEKHGGPSPERSSDG